MAVNGRVLVRIEPASLDLIRRVCETLKESGLDDVVESMVDAGLFREHMTVRRGFKNIVLVGLGPMTELLLLEFEDIARRRWSDATKRVMMQQAARLAGFVED